MVFLYASTTHIAFKEDQRGEKLSPVGWESCRWEHVGLLGWVSCVWVGSPEKGWGSVDGTLPSVSASSMPRLSWCGAGKGTWAQCPPRYCKQVSKFFTHLWELPVVGLVLHHNCLEIPVTNSFFSGILAPQLPVCLYLIFRNDLYLSIRKTTVMEHTADPVLIATLNQYLKFFRFKFHSRKKNT